MSFRKMALNTFSMSSVTVLRMVVQTLAVPVLARLLSPHDYGVVAMAMPVVLFAMMFSDMGIATSLIRMPERSDEIWSPSFWFICALGVGLTAALCLIAPVVAYYMEEPSLTPIIMALSGVILLQAVATVPGAAFQQSHNFGLLALIEIISLAISIAATVWAAYCQMGAWALVVQQLAHYIVKLVLTWFLSPFRPKRIFSIKPIKDHLVFGRDLFGANFVGFASQSLESLIIGKVLGAGQVGIYSMAFLFARLPSRIVSGPLQLVLFPYLAQARDNADTSRYLLLLLTRAMAILVFSGMGLIAVAHEPIFRILLSEKWEAAGRAFMLIAPVVSLQTVTALRFTAVMAAGRTNILLRNAAESSFLWIVCLLIAVGSGTEWVAIAYNIAALLYFPRSIQITLSSIDCPISDYLKAMLVPALTTSLAVLVYLETVAVAGNMGDLLKLSLAMGLAFVSVVISGAFQLKQIKHEIASLKRQQA